MEPAATTSPSGEFGRRVVFTLAGLAAALFGAFLWLFNFTEFF